MIYFDNTATSWPKPAQVSEAMIRFMNETGANPGRAGHRMANDAARVVYDTRECVAELFKAPDPLKVVFTHNITESLNLALLGLLRAGDHVITSSMEHNSVMRPIRVLQKKGVKLTIVQCSPEGFIDPDDVRKSIMPETSMVVLNHASNVTGTIQPAEEIGKISREHNLLFCLDTAQTAGLLNIDMEKFCIDLLGFTGHKSLLGPTGTGGLVIGERVNVKKLQPLKTGGTGSRSDEEKQPEFLPDLCESGTINVVGLAGLSAGIRWIMEKKPDTILAHEQNLSNKLINGLKKINGITIYGPENTYRKTATVSFTIDNAAVSEVGTILDERYALLCRVGLHCSPASHKTIKTFPEGTVRFGPGIFNTEMEIEFTLNAVSEIAKSYFNK